MATTLRKQSPSIKKQLFEKPYEFEFSQALKLLENLYAYKNPIGIAPRADLEAVRIKSNILLSTPPSDLYTLTRPENENFPATLTINFMGIAGQTGPLPNVYSELILDRVKSKDYAFRDFLDIFNNRLGGIHYRIQAKYNITLNPAFPNATDPAKVLKHFGGLVHSESATPHAIPLRSYLKYVGLLWQKPRSAVGLKAALEDFFQLPFEINQFQGQWTTLEHTQCTRIGKRGQHKALGESAALGSKAWIHGEKICLQAGPLSLKDYKAMLPGHSLNTLISEFTRHYLGRENFFDYEIILQDNQATSTKLDGKSALGWTAWMTKTPKDYTPESIRIKPDDPLQAL